MNTEQKDKFSEHFPVHVIMNFLSNSMSVCHCVLVIYCSLGTITC